MDSGPTSSSEAILFPADGMPYMVSLMTSFKRISQYPSYVCNVMRIPHPERYMDNIAKSLGEHAWKYQLVELLDGMNRKFAHPYIIFYPTVSCDGLQFPINKSIKEIQGPAFKQEAAWRGDIVVAKYEDNPFSSLIDASMGDFALVKNYLMTHGSPSYVHDLYFTHTTHSTHLRL
ncbi:hypothetical protein EYR36_003210 [Pleurotus pulmonarius]|nr:hypothetical protein EYR36_003210 [Pleurotus pulmonarius]